MQKLRVESFTVSVDGFGAGPNQSLENSLGVGGQELHQWFFPTKTFQQNVLGKSGGTTGVDNELGGGVNTIRQYLKAQLIDELHLVVSPVILGSGENLYLNLDLTSLGYKCIKNVSSEKAMHLFINKSIDA